MAKPDFQLKWGVNRSGGIPPTDPADYQLGWQYRSGLPPLTGNFDYYQNLADERLLYLNAQGISEWDALTAYDTNAYVKGSDGELYRSTAPTTGNDPTAGAPWTSAQGADFLNTARQNVVSAATTILPTDTAHLNITGTATIGSFTVPSYRCYFVRFDAACTLVNSANLVTQRGADIECSAGDTCLIYATATDAVEVLCFVRGNPGGDYIYGSNANGEYRIHPDGYIEQWLTFSPSASGSTWTFPVPFSVVPTNVHANNNQVGAISTGAFGVTGTKTTTTMIVRCFSDNTTGSTSPIFAFAGGY